MSRVPLGKVLLRNVIRHTDAHNKIQEESDMWKIRELEKQMEDAYRGTKRKILPSSSSRMRSDGFDEESQRDYWRPKNEISGALEDDFLKAKSWNKKLYDYEANMPDRFVTRFLSPLTIFSLRTCAVKN
uniref:NKAP domain containing 1 n=1 Tax=Rousettus aegyptiacus TaxID=9407 RepID=A0A7J8H3B4_ROUAE|nr:NKAP domain containing 1 [Rousettus aegyptiacus]